MKKMVMTQVMKAGLEVQTGKTILQSVIKVFCSTRCQCGGCVAMATNRESLCCCEIDRIVEKKGENESEIQCIVNHKGFNPVCLDLWVSQASYFSYRQRYGDADDKEPHQ